MTFSIETPMTEPQPISPSDQLTLAEVDCLRCIAGHMIPASARHGVPGADDPGIIADMVRSLDRDRAELQRVLRMIDEFAGGRLSALAPAEQRDLLARHRKDGAATLAVIEAVVSRAYYRDDRVLKSIGMEPRPPFPAGYPVEQIDLTLLDPVRQRGSIVREA